MQNTVGKERKGKKEKALAKEEFLNWARKGKQIIKLRKVLQRQSTGRGKRWKKAAKQMG